MNWESLITDEQREHAGYGNDDPIRYHAYTDDLYYLRINGFADGWNWVLMLNGRAVDEHPALYELSQDAQLACEDAYRKHASGVE